MSPHNQIPKSFREVADSSLWMKMRNYQVKEDQDQDQEAVEVACPYYSPLCGSGLGSISDHTSSPANGQTVVGRDSSLFLRSKEMPSGQAGLSHQSQHNQGYVSLGGLLSPAPSTPGSYMSPVSRTANYSQHDAQSALFANDQEDEHAVTPIAATSPTIQLWDNSQPPFLTCPVLQHGQAGNGLPSPSFAHPQTSPALPMNIRYRLTLVPILVNGEFHQCWYPLPEITCAPAQQVEARIQTSERQLLEPPAPRNFLPTNMVLEQSGFGLPISYGKQYPEAKKANYRGDLNSEANRRQFQQLPDAQNCTLWLWNIPVSLHVSELFDQIDTGAVQCCHMVPPNETYITCAAKVAFVGPDAAAKFKQKIHSEEGIWLRGSKLMARYNRDGNLRNDTQQSRVVVIEGPKDLMTLAYWEAYFQKICIFQWDRVLELPCHVPDKKVLQFSFVRLDGQAQACMGAFRSQPDFVGIFRARFALDPCGSPAARALEQNCQRLF